MPKYIILSLTLDFLSPPVSFTTKYVLDSDHPAPRRASFWLADPASLASGFRAQRQSRPASSVAVRRPRSTFPVARWPGSGSYSVTSLRLMEHFLFYLWTVSRREKSALYFVFLPRGHIWPCSTQWGSYPLSLQRTAREGSSPQHRLSYYAVCIIACDGHRYVFIYSLTYLFLYWARVLLCSKGWPGTCCVAQADLELAVLLFQPPKRWK